MHPVFMILYMVEHLRITTVFFWSPLQCEKKLEQVIARTPFAMYKGTFRVECGMYKTIFVINSIFTCVCNILMFGEFKIAVFLFLRE